MELDLNGLHDDAIQVTALTDVPKFGELINNVTASVGREATLACVVDDLSTYKVAWLRVDTQTILTIASHVITKNHRIGVTHSDHRTWYLHVREVRETDRGWYMCQINTDPMKSQVGYLEVVVPPDILDYPTSTDMVVREGTNVTLRCAATGSPQPTVTWRREGGECIPLGSGQEVPSVEGPVFNITRVNRLHMGAYLCIATNGVPPTVSKRIMLIVHFPPMIWIQNQLVGAQEGQQMTLECHSEAYPKSINYWTRGQGEIIAQGSKYEPVLLDNAYKVHMKLTIRAVAPSDFGSYKCVSKNSLGDTDGSIKLYRIPSPSTSSSVTITTQPSVSVDQDKSPNDHHKDRNDPGSYHQESNEIMDMADSEKVTGDRGGAADLKLRGGLRDTEKSSSSALKTSVDFQMFIIFTVAILPSNIRTLFAV
ncbi:opioid-binding protein/cell adhesion molecule homolog isoform X2 [Cryptotermes secundus]|uniref:opioid-binding protein/cell adhesion molecule homolog isoform X2 n=1 Tax=Cryptotermes secundus TaxID=105785 RepID=UPI000CD7B550|nr:opioid-binding protein/cell adhesion molecule homolog isoform X2 [Cryptotermes secundus]